MTNKHWIKIEQEIILLSVEINHEAVKHIGILCGRVVGGDETDDPEDEREEERAYWQHKALCRHPQNSFRVVASQQK